MSFRLPEIREVDAVATHPLRQRLLRPTQTIEEMAYPGDGLPGAGHYAAVVNDAVIGIASISPEAGDQGRGSWRLRGMAVEPDWSGRGIGSALIAAALGHARRADAAGVWCNARTTADGFYERHGFERQGDVFEIDPIGKHVVMWMPLGG